MTEINTKLRTIYYHRLYQRELEIKFYTTFLSSQRRLLEKLDPRFHGSKVSLLKIRISSTRRKLSQLQRRQKEARFDIYATTVASANPSGAKHRTERKHSSATITSTKTTTNTDTETTAL